MIIAFCSIITFTLVKKIVIVFTLTECGGELTTPTGTLTSPNYPGQYAHSRRCLWYITVQTGRRVTLTFTDFALEPHERCAYDYVRVSVTHIH